MANVVFDFTRLLSAFGQSIEKPHLFLTDLARLVEAILVYEVIYVTEPIENLQTKKSVFFDFSRREIYDALLGNVIEKMPDDVEGEALSGPCGELRVAFGTSGRTFCIGDLAAFEDVKSSINPADFMFDWSTQIDDIGVLDSMERVRILLAAAHILRASYDPIPFRAPIVRQMCPANLESVHLKAYRKFEDDLYGHACDLCGHSNVFRLPLLFHYVLSEADANSPDSIFAVAVQLRGDPLVVRLREVFGALVDAYGRCDLPRMARLSRILTAESDAIRARLSGEVTGGWQLRLKLGLTPVIDTSIDLRKIMQRIKDRELYTAVANLSTMSQAALESCVALRTKVERLFDLKLPTAELHRLASCQRSDRHGLGVVSGRSSVAPLAFPEAPKPATKLPR